jgi:hypothetical protein
MQNANSQSESNFNEALKAWEPPDVPTTLDQRVLASYHRLAQRRSWWERFFTSSVRVPLPLVALQVALLLIAGGGFLAFFVTKSEEVLPIASSVQPPAIIAVPVVQEKTIVRTAQRSRKLTAPRPQKFTEATPVLPTSAATRPSLMLTAEALGWHVRADLFAPKPHAEGPEIAVGTENKLPLPASLSYNRLALLEPLQTEWLVPVSNDFSVLSNVGKPKFFEGRISRTVSRAGDWVTKPFEKTEVLYRWIPNLIPTTTALVTPAKNACFSPFRSKPQLVDMQ